MSRSDAWLREFDSQYMEAIDRGVKPSTASDQAVEKANGQQTESLIDRADIERKRRKEDGE